MFTVETIPAESVYVYSKSFKLLADAERYFLNKRRSDFTADIRLLDGSGEVLKEWVED